MDDDFDNYSGDEEFNEDSLTNEEYDALYAAIPLVKAELASYNSLIDDLAIKEALYYNYFEVSPAIEELKNKFPRKKDEPLPPKKMSKLAMLAKLRASAGHLPKPNLDYAKTPAYSTATPDYSTIVPQSGKLSRLATLAKARASKSGEKLEPAEGVSSTLVVEVHSSSATTKLSSLVKSKSSTKGFGTLGKYKLNAGGSGTHLGKTQLSRKSNGGGIELRRKLENAKRLQEDKKGLNIEADAPKSTESSNNEDPMDIDDVNPPHNLETMRKDLKRYALLKQLSFELSVDQSGILRTPQNCVSVFLFESEALNEPGAHCKAEIMNKRRRLSSQLFRAYTNREANLAKVKTNFSLPSPDDKVLNAQKQAFEQSVKELSIKDEKPAKDEPKGSTAKQTDTKPFKKIDVMEELAKNPNFTKLNVSFVIIGHVDAGKSTLMGRILYDSGTVDAKTVNNLVRKAEKSGKGSFALAWIMDQTSEERSRGVTIDVCATAFETLTTQFTAIDAPGHKDFVPQMIGGVSQADTALLVVDSIAGEFEAGFLMDGQTKEHAIIAKNLGITNLCVAVNKLDKENWREARFQDIQEQLTQFLAGDEIGFNQADMSFVPISGLTGCNVVKNDKTMSEFSWYKGPTLIAHLEQIGKTEKKQVSLETLFESDFSLAINDIYDVTSSEFKVKGKISLGMVQPGETVCVHPTGDYLQMQSVQSNGEPVNVAVEGQIVLLTFKVNQLKNRSTNDLSIGDIALSVKSSVRSVKEFHANINTFNMTKPLLVGTPFVLFRNNASVAARINKIVRTNGTKKKKMHLVSRQNAEVVVEILENRRLPVSKFDDNKSLGRVVLRREGITIGAGVITNVE